MTVGQIKKETLICRILIRRQPLGGFYGRLLTFANSHCIFFHKFCCHKSVKAQTSCILFIYNLLDSRLSITTLTFVLIWISLRTDRVKWFEEISSEFYKFWEIILFRIILILILV